MTNNNIEIVCNFGNSIFNNDNDYINITVNIWSWLSLDKKWLFSDDYQLFCENTEFPNEGRQHHHPHQPPEQEIVSNCWQRKCLVSFPVTFNLLRVTSHGQRAPTTTLKILVSINDPWTFMFSQDFFFFELSKIWLNYTWHIKSGSEPAEAITSKWHIMRSDDNFQKWLVSWTLMIIIRHQHYFSNYLEPSSECRG